MENISDIGSEMLLLHPAENAIGGDRVIGTAQG